MKFIILIPALIAVFPLSGKILGSAKWYRAVWILLGFFCFGVTLSSSFAMSVYAWPFWNGHVKGFEITALDLLALALFLAQRQSSKLSYVETKFPLKAQATVFLLAALFSVAMSSLPIASGFYLWQCIRIVFITYVVWKGCAGDEKVAGYLFLGLGIGLCLEAVVVLWLKVTTGVVQSTGTFGHQNMLGMATHFVVFPFAAMILSRKTTLWEKSVVLGGAVIVILTASRATIGLFGLGLATVLILSVFLHPNARKLGMLLVFLAASAVAIPLALSSLDNRFGGAPLSDEYDERAAYAAAAKAMSAAYPLGVGANTFVVVANSKGFYANAGVAPVFNSLSGHVHNVYLLILAEMNIVGLAAFIWGLAIVIVSCFRGAVREPESERGAMLLGIFVTFTIVAAHSWFEWVFITAAEQYFSAVAGGVGLALSKKRPNAPPQKSASKVSRAERPESRPGQSAPSGQGQPRVDQWQC